MSSENLNLSHLPPLAYPPPYRKGLASNGKIKKIAKRAGIKKRIYPHLFRRTRATRLLSKLSESIGVKYLGWVPGSNMVRIYVHLASEDVDEAILKMHGSFPAV